MKIMGNKVLLSFEYWISYALESVTEKDKMKIEIKVLFLVASFSLFQACSLVLPPQEDTGSKNFQAEPQLKLASNFPSIRQNILKRKCLQCHMTSSASKAHKIPFSTEEELLNSTNDEGKILVPGNALASVFFRAMNSDPKIRQDIDIMPPEKEILTGRTQPVTDEELKIVEVWINNLNEGSSTGGLVGLSELVKLVIQSLTSLRS